MTNTTRAVDQVLKTDVLGRVRTPRQRREQLLDEFEGSGASGKKFAQLLGIKYPTFATWVQQRRRQRGGHALAKAPVSPEKMRWLEAVVEQAQGLPAGARSGGAILLHLPGGAHLELHDAKQAEVVAALLRALAQPGTAEKPC